MPRLAKGLFGSRSVVDSLADRVDLSDTATSLQKIKASGIGAGTQGLIDLIPTVVLGSFRADTLSNTPRQDLVFGLTGDDTLIYDVEIGPAGWDNYFGGFGEDVLELHVTEEVLSDPDFLSDLEALQAYIDGGTGKGGLFEFSSINLRVHGIEAYKVLLDGEDVDPFDWPPTPEVQLGFVVEGDYVLPSGDFNNDGIQDFLLLDSGDGVVTVLFGQADWEETGTFPSDLDLSSLSYPDLTTFSATGTVLTVAGIGDVNGDGIDDFVLGDIYDADTNTQNAFVIFGADTSVDPLALAPSSIDDLDATQGFSIDSPSDAIVFSRLIASSAGDLNGDGIGDILLRAPGAEIYGDDALYPGRAYVVFGQDTAADGDFPEVIDLGALNGADGFEMLVDNDYSGLGANGVSIGDFNGDGLDDLVIGGAVPKVNSENGRNLGTHVIFGQDVASEGDFDATIDLDDLDGTDGVTFYGDLYWEHPYSTAYAGGDINGDGIDDLIIAAPGAAYDFELGGNYTYDGIIYVVFGKDVATDGDFDATFSMTSLDGSNGFSILSEDPDDVSLGRSVVPLGDVNGDGFADMLLWHIEDGVGTQYLVFGQDTADFEAMGGVMTLETPENFDAADGYVFVRSNGTGSLGEGQSIGDLDDDGVDDFTISATNLDESVQAYVIYGGATALSTFDAADGTVDGIIDLAYLDSVTDTDLLM